MTAWVMQGAHEQQGSGSAQHLREDRCITVSACGAHVCCSAHPAPVACALTLSFCNSCPDPSAPCACPRRKGLIPRLLRIPPGQAIVWAVSDQITGYLERQADKKMAEEAALA